MSKVQTNKEYNTFVKGLITEVTPLTFPENASLDEDNFELKRDGSRKRRLGIDWEANGTLVDTSKAAAEIGTDAISSHIWDNADRDGLQDIIVVQVGLKLWFFDSNKDAPSANLLNSGSPITITGEASTEIVTASVFGKLIIVNGNKGFFVLSYDQDSDTVSIETRICLVRDIWGVEETETVNERPSSLTLSHEYNLINQGWGAQNPDSEDNESYYTDTKRASGVYPSSADMVSSGTATTEDNKYRFEWLFRNMKGVTTPASKGFCVIDAFRRGESRRLVMQGNTFDEVNTSLTGDPFDLSKYTIAKSIYDNDDNVNNPASLLNDKSEGGLKTAESFAGRLFVAGASSSVVAGDDNSPNLGGYVFFSQVVDNPSKLGRMHQEGDPTSETEFDPIASDGGAVRIPDSGNIIKLLAVGRSLLVFAQNGVWELSGGERNFSATDLEISKITNIGALSPKTVVEVEGSVVYWATSGIYLLNRDQVSGKYAAQNITQTTIQTFYNNISNIAKVNAAAVYDPIDRKIRWLYSDDSAYDGITFKNNYNRELIFDTALQAFYTNTIGSLVSNSPFVAGFVKIPTFSTVVTTATVTDGGVTVTDGGEDVTTSGISRGGATSSDKTVKYLCIIPDTTYSIIFGDYLDPNFKDWFTADETGVDAYAYLITGYETLQESQRNKQAPYITVHMAPADYTFDDRWNIEAATLTTDDLVTGTSPLLLNNFSLSPNGTKLYMLQNGGNIRQFSLGTPFKLDSIITPADLDSGVTGSPQTGLFWSSDGLNAYFLNTVDDILQYSVGTAYDLTGKSFVGSYDTGLIGATNSSGIFWKTDGTKLYIFDNVDAVIYQVDVPTPWDVTSITAEIGFDEDSFSTSPLLFTVAAGGFGSLFRGDMSFKPDGTRLFFALFAFTWDTGDRISRVYQFDMTTPWDVSTITDSLLLEDEGTYLTIPFMDSNSDIISQYTEPTGQYLYTYTVDEGAGDVDILRKYLMPFSDLTGSCLLTARWDFAIHPDSNKFGTQQQVYKRRRYHQVDGFDYGQAVLSSKNKIRGRGKALSLMFETEAGKDCHLYGWGVDFTGVSRV